MQPPESNGVCRDAECGDRIIWAITPKGKTMPVDLEPDGDGNVLITRSAIGGAPIATVVNPTAEPLGGWPGTLHKPHFSTCPGASRWRNRK